MTDVLEKMARAAAAEVEKTCGIDYRLMGYESAEEFVDAVWPAYAPQQRAALTAARDYLKRDGVSALVVAESQYMRKTKGERDTEFVKRIAVGMINAALGIPDAGANNIMQAMLDQYEKEAFNE